MQNACTILLGLMLSVCLTLYGPFGMARAGGGAVFATEICADGAAKTVLFDADGKPVDPSQTCSECLECCQVIGALTPAKWLVASAFVLSEIEVERHFAQNLNLNKRNNYPAPRGPPAAQFSMMSMPRLTAFDRSVICQISRSDGRPLLKEANA